VLIREHGGLFLLQAMTGDGMDMFWCMDSIGAEFQHARNNHQGIAHPAQPKYKTLVSPSLGIGIC